MQCTRSIRISHLFQRKWWPSTGLIATIAEVRVRSPCTMRRSSLWVMAIRNGTTRSTRSGFVRSGLFSPSCLQSLEPFCVPLFVLGFWVEGPRCFVSATTRGCENAWMLSGVRKRVPRRRNSQCVVRFRFKQRAWAHRADKRLVDDVHRHR